MPEPFFMQTCMYIMPSEATSSGHFINPFSDTNTAVSQIVLYYSLHYVYKLKLFFKIVLNTQVLLKENQKTISFHNLLFHFVFAFACMYYVFYILPSIGQCSGKALRVLLILLPGNNSVTDFVFNLDHF
jgi:hypothetical protein